MDDFIADSYFPIKIKIVKDGTFMVCDTPEDIPDGTGFIVVQTQTGGSNGEEAMVKRNN